MTITFSIFYTEIQVSNNKGTARLPASNYTIATRSVKLRSFSRIIKGDSLRIMSIAPASTFSPARILDLKASIEEKEVLLIWVIFVIIFSPRNQLFIYN